MGVNTAATVGRVRTAPAVASTLDRLVKDGEAAKALAIKLEENLVQPAEEVKGETEGKEGDVKMEGGEGDKKGEGIKERGSEVVEETIRRVLGKEGLAGEEEGRSEEEKIKRVSIFSLVKLCRAIGDTHCCCGITSSGSWLTLRPSSFWTTGSRTSGTVFLHATTVSPPCASPKSSSVNA
jgi:hypothetical protein